MTTASVAAELNCSTRTVQRYARQERLRAVQVPTGPTGALLFDRADVLRLKAELFDGPGAA